MRTDLEKTQRLFDLLRGNLPDDCRIKPDCRPNLTAKQAWTVIWWLGNQYWQVPDFIERCCVCGRLYDTNESGKCFDWGEPPNCVCDGCTNDATVTAKLATNPAKEDR